MSLDSLLNSLQDRGVALGLERIQTLLEHFDSPHLKVPIIHVAGTNGKGSVCAYLSSILSTAGYRVGRYTSPHLVSWNERICLNDIPIPLDILTTIIISIVEMTEKKSIPLTQFEVVTAAAWLYFAQNEVDIAVMEVGLGGRLDATNIVPHPLVTVITSISKDHWQVLGDTLAAIAFEKAGILKPLCPVVVGVLPQEAETVVKDRIKLLNCPNVWVKPAELLSSIDQRAIWGGISYSLPLLGDVQLINSALAIATIQVLQEKGWSIPDTAIISGLSSTAWPGRLQWVLYQSTSILIDGAHNIASAQVLRRYVDSLNRPLNWVIGMLATKDHQDILKVLLKEGDRLSLVPVPCHSTAEPAYLASLAVSICPHLDKITTYTNVETALQESNPIERLVVLSGSLYLVGYFLSPWDQLTQS